MANEIIYPIPFVGIKEIEIMRIQNMAIVVPETGSPYLIVDYYEYYFGDDKSKNCEVKRKVIKTG